MKIAVLGAGAWGTALAVNASARHGVKLWLRDPAQAQALRADRENKRYLPGIGLPAAIDIRDDAPGLLPALVGGCDDLIALDGRGGLVPLLQGA